MIGIFQRRPSGREGGGEVRGLRERGRESESVLKGPLGSWKQF